MSSSGGFFDRFGAKERTGLGGRSKVLVSPEPTSPMRVPPSAGYVAVPQQYGYEGQRSVDADTRLLMGIGAGPASTFRTSEVLRGAQGPPGAGAARWLDFNSTGEDDTDTDGRTFFEDVERMRLAHATGSNANIYGTPFHVTQMREEELRRRRPSFGEDPHHEPPPMASHYVVPPVQYTSPTHYALPSHRPRQGMHLAPMDYAASPSPPAPSIMMHHEGSPFSPHLQRKAPRSLDPITLPINKERKRIQPRKQTTAHTSSPQSSYQQQEGGARTHRASPPLISKLPPPHRKDVANLPGAVYSRAIPQVVHGILYGA